MMSIEIRINGRLVAGAIGHNVTDLDDVSDYDVAAWSGAWSQMPAPLRANLTVAGHKRAAGPWELVRRIAEAMVTTTELAPSVQHPVPEIGSTVEPTIAARFQEGRLDEIVGTGVNFHMESLGDGDWWFAVSHGDQRIDVRFNARRISVDGSGVREWRDKP